MKKTLFLFPTLALAATLAAASAQAQTFTIGYNFSGENGVNGASYAATATTSSVTLGAATRGSGFGTLDPNGAYSAYYANGGVGLSLARANTFYATTTDAESDGEYLTFTLTPINSVSLSQLIFGAGIQNGGAYTGLAYSLDGGSTFSEVTGTQSTTNGANLSPAVGTYSLTGIAGLQDIAANQNVIFHLYDLTTRGAGYEVGNFDQSGTNTLDVEVDGAVVPASTPAPTPEPGTWVMMIGGVGLLAVVQRARRRAA